MVQSFGFQMKVAVIIEPCFAHRGKDFSASCASEGLGAQPRELNPNDQRGAPFHVGRVRGKKGEDEGMSESFPGFQGTPQSSVCTCSPFYGWGD